jgi:tetratricopeptide (TPR) repeat protein
MGRYAAALNAYDKAVALNPFYHQAWFNRGKLLAEMGAYGNALESYDRAIALEAAPHYLHAREDIWLKNQLFADNRVV